MFYYIFIGFISSFFCEYIRSTRFCINQTIDLTERTLKQFEPSFSIYCEQRIGKPLPWHARLRYIWWQRWDILLKAYFVSKQNPTHL